MHKHIVRLLTLVAIIAVVATTAKFMAIQDTFHQYGHYRGASVAQIAAKLPKHQGSASCQSCHKEIYAEWSSGIHQKANKDGKVVGTVVKSGVNCEVCHNGPAGNHPSKDAMPLSTEDQVTTITHLKHTTHPANVADRNLMRDPEDMRVLCTNCHEKIAGRPLRGRDEGGVPQVVVDGHGGKAQCTSCHNPHSPRISFAAIPRPPVDPTTGKALPVSAAKAGDAGAGKSVAAACAACHGNSGASVNPEWPNLAGQNGDYLVNSLKAFKEGARKNDLMSPMAAGLSDADMRNVAAYFSRNSCSVTGGDKDKAALGKAKAAAAGCAACHNSGGLNKPGASGIAGAQVWPNLAGQNAGYLAVALKSFQDGSRSHAVMSSVAKTLSASDIDNLAAYYATASCK
ncbi:c-type cytochrome [Candidatus Ferrigenium straubiae]|jgi:cytochrome c553/nitrate/TMAO reductase-like tetraheme cytochrome c subunit|uniref:c-type cytochrome n=1 Tax=Candidatus Ferrigenium straubiae TaxID=2919506 RepID=UPI003F4ADF1C